MRRLAFLACVVIATPGCSCSDDDGAGGGGTGMDGSTGGTDGGGGSTVLPDGRTIDSPFTTDESGRVVCPDGEPCACDNGMDDDGDGLTDGLDPECTGPYDDDEGSFATGIPGDNVDFCQDCFFDGNSGHGDDGCQYHTDCLYGEEPPAGGGGCFSCDVTAGCVDFCRARTPNGCDCFGCCEVLQDDGTTVNVYLSADCSLDNIDDTEACPRCELSADCVNECGECELCPGKTVEDLPESCYEGGMDAGTPTYTCEDGEQVCDDTTPCPDGYYCQLGCCLVAPI